MIGTAAGTLGLAIATFASRCAPATVGPTGRTSSQIGIRPVLATSRLEDAPIKIMYGDQHWVKIEGGAPLRGHRPGHLLGHGLAQCRPASPSSTAGASTPSFRPLLIGPTTLTGSSPRLGTCTSRPTTPGSGRERCGTRTTPIEAARQDRSRPAGTLDLLYGDHEGGQRAISRFSLVARADNQWLASVVRHWNLEPGRSPA